MRAIPRSHLHLWSLPDGTGLHAPYAELVAEEGTSRLCCHLCGRWYVSLGAHVRAHGHTADTYRLAMGLCTTQPLTSTPLSAQRRLRRVAALAAGRRTVAARREQELARRLAAWGHPSLHHFLRCAYSEGASLDDLARQTGLGRARLRQEVRAAGMTDPDFGIAPVGTGRSGWWTSRTTSTPSWWHSMTSTRARPVWTR